MAKSGNARKYGRGKDRPSNKAYTASHRRERNKAANIERDKRDKVRAAQRKATQAIKRAVLAATG